VNASSVSLVRKITQSMMHEFSTNFSAKNTAVYEKKKKTQKTSAIKLRGEEYK